MNHYNKKNSKLNPYIKILLYTSSKINRVQGQLSRKKSKQLIFFCVHDTNQLLLSTSVKMPGI